MIKSLILFPGQGSQRVGMGKAFLEQWPRAKEYFAMADEAIKFSLSKLCVDGSEDQLNMTQYAQPALLTVGVVAYEYLKEHAPQVSPTALCGHSLGEYSALVAGGALKFDQAVKIVHQRGLFMQQAVSAGVGGMAAVIGAPIEEIEKACKQASSVDAKVEIANLNDISQTVISGEKQAVTRASEFLSTYRVVELQVSVPSHCYLMAPAAIKLSAELKKSALLQPTIPVYANVTAEPYKDAESITNRLSEQLTGRVRWFECVRNALGATGANIAIECGSGAVLTNLMKKISPDTKRVSFDAPEKLQAIGG